MGPRRQNPRSAHGAVKWDERADESLHVHLLLQKHTGVLSREDARLRFELNVWDTPELSEGARVQGQRRGLRTPRSGRRLTAAQLHSGIGELSWTNQ